MSIPDDQALRGEGDQVMGAHVAGREFDEPEIAKAAWERVAASRVDNVHVWRILDPAAPSDAEEARMILICGKCGAVRQVERMVGGRRWEVPDEIAETARERRRAQIWGAVAAAEARGGPQGPLRQKMRVPGGVEYRRGGGASLRQKGQG